MNARQANQKSIRNYLSSIGISPVSVNKRSSLYLAPYRSETIPSLKVSHDQNLWVDYGNDNKGGTLIDLVIQIHPSYNVSDAIVAVEKSTQSFFSFHQQKTIENSIHETRNTKHEIDTTNNETQKPKTAVRYSTQQGANCNLQIADNTLQTANCNQKFANQEIANTGADSQGYLKPVKGIHNSGSSKQQYLTRVTGAINIYKLQELGINPAITAYLKLRGVQIATALPFCKEIYYTIGKKKYFGLGNQNNKGWAIRNKYWKGCTAQGYSFYKKDHTTLSVFEGIFDLLSYIELNKSQPEEADFLVLNSLVNLKKTIPIIETYKEVTLFLDHDQAGRNATKTLMELLPDSRDGSDFYSSFKDLNDYHLKKNEEQLLIGKGPLLKDNCSSRVYEASHVLARPKRLLR